MSLIMRKFRIQKGLYDLQRQAGSYHSSPQSQDICIIMQSCGLCTETICAESRPYSLHFIGCYGNADPRSANQDPLLTFSFLDRSSHFSGIYGIIHRLGTITSKVLIRDLLLLQTVGYEPRQGDVVVLTKEFDASDGPIVKRVIAVGGQTVDIDYEAGTVSVDGQVLDEPYINPEEIMAPPSNYEHATHVEVPEGSIFVMGDNRNHSSDSRDVTLGAVDERYVLGRALWIILPFDHFGAIPDGTEG